MAWVAAWREPYRPHELWHAPNCSRAKLHPPIVQRAVVETLDDWPVKGLTHACVRPDGLTSQTDRA